MPPTPHVTDAQRSGLWVITATPEMLPLGNNLPRLAGCRLNCSLLSWHHPRSTGKNKGPHKRPLNLAFPYQELSL